MRCVASKMRLTKAPWLNWWSPPRMKPLLGFLRTPSKKPVKRKRCFFLDGFIFLEILSFWNWRIFFYTIYLQNKKEETKLMSHVNIIENIYYLLCHCKNPSTQQIMSACKFLPVTPIATQYVNGTIPTNKLMRLQFRISSAIN